MVADLYAKLGFTAHPSRSEVARYRLDLATDDVQTPEFIRVAKAKAS